MSYVSWEIFVPNDMTMGYELTPIRIVLTGSRSITDKSVIHDCIRDGINEFTKDRKDINKFFDVCLILGGASGVDSIGELFAKHYNLSYTIRKADWKQYQLAAGSIRNGEMVEHATHCIAIHDGVSKGTKDCIRRAKKKGIQVYYNLINNDTVIKREPNYE